MTKEELKEVQGGSMFFPLLRNIIVRSVCFVYKTIKALAW